VEIVGAAVEIVGAAVEIVGAALEIVGAALEIVEAGVGFTLNIFIIFKFIYYIHKIIYKLS
jgi:hypothetical protein